MSSRVKYQELESESHFDFPAGVEIFVQCCDCGLVHKEIYTPLGNGMIRMTAERDNRKTAAQRRARNITIERAAK
jgi:hypothetical protein